MKPRRVAFLKGKQTVKIKVELETKSEIVDLKTSGQTKLWD